MRSWRLEMRTEPGLRTTWWAPSEGYKPGDKCWWLMFGRQAVRPASDVEVDLYERGFLDARSTVTGTSSKT